jgi:branched-chain amino acid transport system substrate-binding protein
MIAAACGVLTLACSGGASRSDKPATATSGGGGTPGATAVATSSSGTSGTVTIKKGETIRIGISTALTPEGSDKAILGVTIRDSALLAIREKGAIKGFTVEGDARDDECLNQPSVDAANKLIADKVAAVIGPTCANGAFAALDLYSRENLLVISSSVGWPSLTQQGKKNLFRTAWNDDAQGAEMAKYAITTLGKKNAVLVTDQSLYGQGIMDTFNERFTQLGGKVVSEEALNSGGKDFGPTVTRMESEHPDIIVFGGLVDDGAVLVRQLSDAGVTAAFMGADSIADAAWIALSGGKAEGAYVSRALKPTDPTLNGQYVAAYQAAYPGRDALEAGRADVELFGAQTYDAVHIILNAIEQVATVDSSGNFMIDQDKLIAAVRGVDYRGASGEIQFDDAGDRQIVGAVNEIDKVKGGKFVRVQ